MTNVQIYVGTYSKYNNGSIFGAWIKLEDFSSMEELSSAMRKLHKDEDDPEFMFQDYECSGIMENLGLISECHIAENIYEIMEAIENSSYSEDVIEAYVSCLGNSSADIHTIIEKVEECYSGEYSNDIDFTEDLLDSTGEVSNDLPNYIYIDWERTARDIMMDYTSFNNHYFRLI
jgi:antirestriction protein